MRNPHLLRLPTLVAFSLLPLALNAQSAAPTASAPPPAEETVQLTPFVVAESEDRGYAATSTLAGTRLRTDLRDVGAAISVARDHRPYVSRRYTVLGTDGFGRSDTRGKLRHFFEVDRHWVAVASLAALADEGMLDRGRVAEAIKKYGLDPAKPNPLTV